MFLVSYDQSWKDMYVCSGTRSRIEMVAVGQCLKITHVGLKNLGMTEDYVALNLARQILPCVTKGPCFVVIRHTRECQRTGRPGSSAISL